MLEKNSQIVLTENDLTQYNNGVVSERIKQIWGEISISELSELIASNQIITTLNQKVSSNESR